MGRLSDRPRESFRFGCDVFARYFLALRPVEQDVCLFWIAKALTNFDVNHNHP